MARGGRTGRGEGGGDGRKGERMGVEGRSRVGRAGVVKNFI